MKRIQIEVLDIREDDDLALVAISKPFSPDSKAPEIELHNYLISLDIIKSLASSVTYDPKSTYTILVNLYDVGEI
jgi:hypothetical protein